MNGTVFPSLNLPFLGGVRDDKRRNAEKSADALTLCLWM